MINIVTSFIKSIMISLITFSGIERHDEYIVFNAFIYVLFSIFMSLFPIRLFYEILMVGFSYLLFHYFFRLATHIHYIWLILGYTILSFCRLISSIIMTTLNLQFNIILDYPYLYLIETILMIPFCLYFVIKKKRLYPVNAFRSLLPLFLAFDFMNYMLAHMIYSQEIMAVYLVLSFICLLVILYQTSKFIFYVDEYKDLEIRKVEADTQERIVRNNLVLLENISNELDEISSHMNDVLVSIKDLVSQDNKEGINQLVDENIHQLFSRRHNVSTNNPVFDNLLIATLKNYADRSLKPDLITTCEPDIIDANLPFASRMIETLNQLAKELTKENHLTVSIVANKEYISFTFVLTNHTPKQYEIVNKERENLVGRNFYTRLVMPENDYLEVKYLIYLSVVKRSRRL